MTVTEKMIALLGELRRQMNGAVTGGMEDRGLSYNLNYGVSLPTIKKISEPYFPDHPLALHLYKQDVRELKIAATYIADPSMLTAEQMRDWVRRSPSDEITELMAMNLFHRSPVAAEEIKSWYGDERLAAAAIWTTGKMAAAGNDMTGSIPGIETATSFDTGIIARGAVFALRKIANLSSGKKAEIVSLRKKMSAGNHAQKYIAEELAWQLDEQQA